MYSGKAKEFLKGAEIGDKIVIIKDSKELSGILMPRNELADDKHVVIKLPSGYNIGCAIENSRIKIIEKRK